MASAEEKELEQYATKMGDRLRKFKARVDQLEEMREERTADRAKARDARGRCRRGPVWRAGTHRVPLVHGRRVQIIEECEDLKASIKTARKGFKTSLSSVDPELQEQYDPVRTSCM